MSPHANRPWRIILFALFLFPFVYAVPAAEPTSTAVGELLQVFPGDRFYVEGDRIEVEVLQLASAVESRMPGAMRIPFSFAIDSLQLRWVRDRGGWRYFATPEGKARAWHGLVGNVLAPGDTVGIRIRLKDGAQEWFVDNSRHNGMTTIWSRPVNKKKDVEIRTVGTTSVLPEGGRLRGLEYMGTKDGQLRIRYVEFGDLPRQEEFLFPIAAQMPMVIGILGLRGEVESVDGVAAKIRVLKGFDHENFANPSF